MDSLSQEVEKEIVPFIRVFKDGSVERLSGSPLVPPSPHDLETGVSSKDIIISQNPLISARLYFPHNLTHDQTQSISRQKLPILLYFHGGGFCFESAFSFTETTYMYSLVSQAKAVAVSIEYRLAPEHPLPAAYEDCWTALQWVASLSSGAATNEPWLSNHGNFERLFMGGDSAGANIVHNIIMRAGTEGLPGGVKVLGAFLTHPYFWGSNAVGFESTVEHEKKLLQDLAFRVWNFVNPSAPGGINNPTINPIAPGAPTLAKLGCSRLLVCVASMDVLRDRGVCYYEAVKESGWEGDIELIEVEGENHAFHILKHGTESSRTMIKYLASFLVK